MDATGAQRSATAEATARRRFRVLQSDAGTDCDEADSVTCRQWPGAERAVVLQRQTGHGSPPSRRS